MNILITGSNGFIGKNLVAWLGQRPDTTLLQFDVENTRAELDAFLAQADFVFHLAGVNRPRDESEFKTGNVDLTAYICARLGELGRATPLLLSSSIQAELDNPYGISKRQAEEIVARYAEQSGARVIIYRLPGVFGKWCRPNYNSVVATFCYNIAHDLPITISDPAREVLLVYIDDVIESFVTMISDQRSAISHQPASVGGQQSSVGGQRSAVGGQQSLVIVHRSLVVYASITPVYRITLGQLAETIRAFRAMRQSLVVPDLSDAFTRKLYGTFVSYYEADNLGYALEQKRDARGALAEFLKSPHVGQIFISRTKPGITRGNHYHHTKAEKFMVIEGEAIIRLRHIRGRKSEVRDQESGGGGQKSDIIEYRVRGEDFRVIDIPPGYTHSIENVGQGELVTLFWSSEVLDPNRTDTYALQV